MSKFFPKQRLLIASLLIIPVAVFFLARSAASWRPQLVGQLHNTMCWDFKGSRFLHLSPNERWLVCEGMNKGVNQGKQHISSILLDLTGGHPLHTLQGTDAVFSGNSRFIATYQYPVGELRGLQRPELFLYDGPHLKWHRPIIITNSTHTNPVNFAANDSQVQYHTSSSETTHELLTSFDVQTGKEIGQKDLGVSPWQEEATGKSTELSRTKISFFDPNSNLPISSFQTSDHYDIWNISPDRTRLWVALAKHNRFDIRDAKTGYKLWSLLSTNPHGTYLFPSYPSWEKGGKMLAMIENDTLVVRDGHTGKVLLSHKNNLPVPLVSWALTQDGNTVYLMDEKGEIFRQRLR